MVVWRRWDADSFQEASKRDPLAHKSPEEIFSSIVHKLVSTAVSSGTEEAATKIVEVAMNEKANVVTDEALEAILSLHPNKKPVDQACQKMVGAREIADTLNKSLTEGCSAADVKRVIEYVRVKDVKEARESVMREVNCARGSQNEHKGIASYENVKRVKLHGKNTKFYKKCIGVSSAGTNVYVGGRVDGLTHDRVVEIKSQRNRLFNTLPLYEKVQVQAYLFLTDKPVVEVVQNYNGLTRTDEYVPDAEFWSEVCDAALKFASELEVGLNSKTGAPWTTPSYHAE